MSEESNNDRLEEIQERYRETCVFPSRVYEVQANDLAWLIQEVEQLRSLNQTQEQSITTFQSQLRVMREAIEAVDRWFTEHYTEIPCTIPIGPITAQLRSSITPKGSEQ